MLFGSEPPIRPPSGPETVTVEGGENGPLWTNCEFSVLMSGPGVLYTTMFLDMCTNETTDYVDAVSDELLFVSTDLHGDFSHALISLGRRAPTG